MSKIEIQGKFCGTDINKKGTNIMGIKLRNRLRNHLNNLKSI